MKTRLFPRVAITATLGVSTLLLPSGCARPPIEAKPPAYASDRGCEDAARSWPKDVAGLSPYPVTTPSNAVRAWGKRPEHSIIARCGVASPGPTQDACIDVNGVDWVQSPLGKDAYRYVTYGRTPALEVLVPSDLGGTPATYLPPFTKAAQAVPQGSHRCTS